MHRLRTEYIRLAHVYGLFDPDTGELRYIGCTGKRLSFRMSAHLTGKPKNSRVGRWLASLREAGKKPDARVLAECPWPSRYACEREWIERHISPLLLNSDPRTLKYHPEHRTTECPQKVD